MKDKLWLVFILITITTWGIWGAFSDLQMDRDGIPETVVYILWALSMVPCAIVALIINKGKFMQVGLVGLYGWSIGRGRPVSAVQSARYRTGIYHLPLHFHVAGNRHYPCSCIPKGESK